MKLKRSFSAKFNILTIALVFFLFSCNSTGISVPVPGQGDVKVKNIYAEYYNLGESYYKLEDYKTAAEYYELAMKKKEQYWASYYKLAKCYVFTSDWNNALPMYKKILERDNENASIKASVAYIYSMQGNYKQAKKIYEELLEEQPKNQDFLENYLAVLLSNEKRFKKDSELFLQTFDVLKTEYPEDRYIKNFDEKYKKLMDIVDELPEEEETEDEDEETSEESSEENNEESSDITE